MKKNTGGTKRCKQVCYLIEWKRSIPEGQIGSGNSAKNSSSLSEEVTQMGKEELCHYTQVETMLQ